MNLRALYLCCLLHIVVLSCFAQDPALYKPANFAPPSPDVANLAKFSLIPLTHYNGLANIGIPLYKIKTRDLELPVSLSYHSGGNKVEDVASSVGLGWALQTGGSITVSVQGIPDERVNQTNYSWYIQRINTLKNKGSLNGTEQGELQELIDVPGFQNYIDFAPDIYVFSFGGYSGKFMLGDDNKFYTAPYQPLKIYCDKYDGNSSYVRQFIITDPKGVRYIFGRNSAGTEYTESTVSYSQCTVPIGSPDEPLPVTTAWKLAEIISPNADTIRLHYTTSRTTYKINSESSTTHNVFQLAGSGGSLPPLPLSREMVNCTSENNTYTDYPDRIEFSNGSIQFVNSDRNDLTGGKKVDAINVFNKQGQPIKKYQFGYSYFKTLPNSTTSEELRLRLDSLKEIDVATGTASAVHAFNYNNTPLPPRLEHNKQDHWGYYSENPSTPPDVLDYYQGIDGNFLNNHRNIDTTSVKAAILEKITYPTGGSTRFEYEPNQLEFVNFKVDSVISRSKTHLVTSNNAQFRKDSFDINIATPFLKVNVLHEVVSGQIFPDTRIYLRKRENPGFEVDIFDSLLDSSYLYLTNGRYYLNSVFPTKPPTTAVMRTELSWKEKKAKFDTTYYKSYAGGLRIKSITDSSLFETAEPFKRIFRYQDVKLLESPRYETAPIQIKMYGDMQMGTTYVLVTREYTQTKYSAYSNYPLLQPNGACVYYPNVSELVVSARDTLRTDYTYTWFPDQMLPSNHNFPYAPKFSFEHRRGQLLKKEEFKKEGTLFRPVKRTAIKYWYKDVAVNFPQTTFPDSAFRKTMHGVKIGARSVTYGYVTNIGWYEYKYNINQVSVAPFKMISEAFLPQSDTTVTYGDDNTNTLSITKSIQYDTTVYQPAIITTFQSNGDEKQISNKYPLNYPRQNGADPATRALKKMQDAHMIGEVVEQVTSIKKNGSNTWGVLDAILKEFNENNLKYNAVYKLTADAPRTNFIPFTITNGVSSKDAAYEKRLTFDRYDTYGNLLQQTTDGGETSSYIWNKDYPGPIAIVTGSAYDNIAYTSFEAANNESWSFAGTGITDASVPSGKKYYNLASGNISKSGLAAGIKFRVSYWTKNASPYTIAGTIGSPEKGRSLRGWTFYSHQVTGVSTVTLSGTGFIDELKLHPADASIATYTYEPLVGLTSQSDSKGQFIYYEYDGLNRLKTVRDLDGMILKQYDYQYRQPVTQ
ncbi:hypothetical protein [Chitinophaga nivalis]|uniref:YD repeat-containing protein n=1 Tax=Chitinophaga nivalis TaxID=2991709 RepID=A0ABT3IHL9_9BACT|nr:hypothetical protein [Chitinophaga nivalis]MCW3467014.1 hypothetical protein [Chitinophaga nivalis]MCW3483295.1 hypothetical protein [Chitinophaga nivalis]